MNGNELSGYNEEKGYDTAILRDEDVEDAEVSNLLDEIEGLEADISVTISAYQDGKDVDVRLNSLFSDAREKLERCQEIYGSCEVESMEGAYSRVSEEPVETGGDDFIGLDDISLEETPDDEYLGEEVSAYPGADIDIRLVETAERMEYTLRGAEFVRSLS